MNTMTFKKILLSTALFLGGSSLAMAHSASGIPMPADASATDLAAVTCFNNGSGPTARLEIDIEDSSAPVTNLLVSMQARKDSAMTNITDQVSGDGKAVSGSLTGGDGTYYISINKSGPGTRTFGLTWHCMTQSGAETGSSIDVLQFQ